MGISKRMNILLKYSIVLFLFICFAFTQKTPAFSFCDKTADCNMSWDDFMKCKKELISTEKSVFINSFMVTIQKAEKKDTLSVQFKSKGNVFSRTLIESIEKLHKDKKMGRKVIIEDVELIQSGKAAKKDAGFTITLY